MEEWRRRIESVGAVLRCTRAEAAALAVLLAGALAAVAVVWWLARPEPATGGASPASVDPTPAAPTDPASAGRSQGQGSGEDGGLVDEVEPVVVHVAGEVADPGVVQVPAGSRVRDAVDAAGGPTDDAELGGVNLARVVDDGEQVVIGHVDDGEAGGQGGADAVGADGRVDVNRADAVTLEDVPGIGPVTAERIVAHREEHGPFTAEQELLDVPGIGERTLDQLVDHLRW